MKNYTYRLSMLALLGASTALAQPPGPPDRPGPGGPPGGPGGGFRMPPHPLMEALDANHDQIISDEELQAATKSLLTLDKNGDGKLTPDETQPTFPPRPDRFGGGGFGGGDRGPGPRDGNRPEGGDPSRRPRGPEGPDGAARDREPGDRGPSDRRPGSEAGRFGGPPEGRGGPGGPPGGPGGPGFQGPNPERFVAMAMEFDADKDGKLNRDELFKFAQEMPMRRPGGPEGGPGPRGPGGPDGSGRRPEGGRPEGGRPEGGRPEGGSGGRPDRPQRPE